MIDLLSANNLKGGHYAEAYAGGASLALSLLYSDTVSHVHLNDLDRSIYAFWKAATEHTDDLIEKIKCTEISMDSWHEQQEIQKIKNQSTILELGFSTFFLNRTNRSGILMAGVIGGKSQQGKWKMDARFHKENLIARIRRVGTFRSRISVTKFDAIEFINRRKETLPEKSFIYLDPPYYYKGQDLYLNAYQPEDHEAVANAICANSNQAWMVSYDDVPQIRKLYGATRKEKYSLRYSASVKRSGGEVMFLSPGLRVKKPLLHVL